MTLAKKTAIKAATETAVAIDISLVFVHRPSSLLLLMSSNAAIHRATKGKVNKGHRA